MFNGMIMIIYFFKYNHIVSSANRFLPIFCGGSGKLCNFYTGNSVL